MGKFNKHLLWSPCCVVLFYLDKWKVLDLFSSLVLFFAFTCLKLVRNPLTFSSTLLHYCRGFLQLLPESLLSFYCHLLNQKQCFYFGSIGYLFGKLPRLVRALLWAPFFFFSFRSLWIESRRVSLSYHWYNVRDPAVRPHEVWGQTTRFSSCLYLCLSFLACRISLFIFFFLFVPAQERLHHWLKVTEENYRLCCEL